MRSGRLRRSGGEGGDTQGEWLVKTLHCGPFPCGCKLLLGDVNLRPVFTVFLCDAHTELLRPEIKALAEAMRAIIGGKRTPKVGSEKPECTPSA